MTVSTQSSYSPVGNDTFTQLLGVNDSGLIAGYHGQAVNKGFVLRLPNTFTDQNFPGSSQTQVVGINNASNTAGFYVDAGGTTHAFLNTGNSFTPRVVASRKKKRPQRNAAAQALRCDPG